MSNAEVMMAARAAVADAGLTVWAFLEENEMLDQYHAIAPRLARVVAQGKSRLPVLCALLMLTQAEIERLKEDGDRGTVQNLLDDLGLGGER